ncbi:MAG: UDP-3-O-(3-hydroxymyristoyl)glucosamine N-acyltransferase [Terrimicrobiaceae bacterium]
MTLREAAKIVGGRVAPEHLDLEITGPASLDDAGPGDFSFYSSPKYLKTLRKSKATACLVPEGFDDQVDAAPVFVEKPSMAFSVLLEHFAPRKVVYPVGIHPTAVVAEDAHIAGDVHLGALVVVESGARIGRGCVVSAGAYIGHQVVLGEECLIYPAVTILERSLIGDRVILHPGVVLGSDGFGYELREGRQQKILQTGIVEIGDDVEIGANTTIDRARFGKTRILAGTKIDNLVQIAHNVSVGEHCILCAQVGISGSTKVGNAVTLAGKVGLNGHIEIGDGVIVSAMAGVTKSVPPKEILVGLPARPMRDFKENFALLRNINKLYERVKVLEDRLAGTSQ